MHYTLIKMHILEEMQTTSRFLFHLEVFKVIHICMWGKCTNILTLSLWLSAFCTHFPKNNLNLGIKTDPVKGWSRCNSMCLASRYRIRVRTKLKPDIYRCICSSFDRHGCTSNMEFQIFLAQFSGLVSCTVKDLNIDFNKY